MKPECRNSSPSGHRPSVLALTGNPGAGKTTAAEFLKELGARVLSGDALGYILLQVDSPVYAELVREFGASICEPDGTISRAKLGQLVFSSPECLQTLTVVSSHTSRIREEIDHFKQSGDSGPFVVDAALIYEWGIAEWFDKVIVVTAPLEIRKRRFNALRSGAGSLFEQREAAQIPQEVKEQQADMVIHNDSDPQHLRKQLVQIFKESL